MTFGYTIDDFEEYDKNGFETMMKALRSSKATVRNLQRRYDSVLRLSAITLTTTDPTKEKELREFERVELR